MADDEQNQQPPRYWFPYWSGVPQTPPPSRLSRPPVRPQQSRRLSPPSPAAAPSSPRRPSPSPQHRHQPNTTTTATRGAAPPPPATQSQVSRPSPSRTSPLAPIRAPAPPSNNSNAVVAAAPAPPAKPPAIPAVLLLSAEPEAAPGEKDVDVVLLPVKTVAHVQQPAAGETKPHAGHGKGADKEHKAHHHKEEKEKDEHKSKDKEKEKDHKEKKDETKSKDKEKEKDHKEKEKKHHAGEDGKHKEVKAEHGKLHREIKAGVADMVHKANGAAASGSGHERGATSVITLAGENKGASMRVGSGKSKDGGEWHGRGHRLDGGSGSDGKKAAGKAGMMTTLINSNVQVINNSLLLQSSCNGGDPGVHLKLSAKSASKDKQKHAGGGDKAAAAGKK